MPPVMEMPVDEEVILSDDPEIAMFDADHPDVKYVFTDIAMGIKNRVSVLQSPSIFFHGSCLYLSNTCITFLTPATNNCCKRAWWQASWG